MKISITLLLSAQSIQETTPNAYWQFSRTDYTTWRSATVPGTVHTNLLARHLVAGRQHRQGNILHKTGKEQ